MPLTAKKVNILGTEYSISYSTPDKDERLKNVSGYCDSYSKTIVIDDIECNKFEEQSKGEFEKECIRHEIIHAFLSESGLKFDANVWSGSWAKNEEMIDWIAIQFPKIHKVYEDLGIL